MRNGIMKFANAMEERLERFDNKKTGWGSADCTDNDLIGRLLKNVANLFDYTKYSNDALLDIANYAMMLWNRRNNTGQYK
jgi:hypothetical protein